MQGKYLLLQPGILAPLDHRSLTRPPLEYLKPFEKPVYKRLEGIIEPDRNYFGLFENGPPPEKEKVENYKEHKEREWREKTLEHIKKVKEEMKNWDPKYNPNATHEPYKTLFVCRLNKDTTEKYLKRVFEEYGPVKKVVIVKDLNGNSRKYGFVEFENYDDFRGALTCYQ